MLIFQVLHGIERGEPAALLLSPLKPMFKKPCDTDQNGSQFTFFLTSPLAAFCHLVGLSSTDTEAVSRRKNKWDFNKISRIHE